MSVHSGRARRALQDLVESDPAIAALSLWCTHLDGERTATRGSVITYGPEFEALERHEQQGLAAHHVLHVALRHSARSGGMAARLGEAFDADRYNLACDAVVNEALLLADHALPRPAVTLCGVLGLKAAPEVALAQWDVERVYFALTGTGGARGYRPDLEREEGPEGTREDRAGDQTEALWRQHLARALETGRRAGRGLGRIGHRIADVPEPRTPWEVVLRRLLTVAATPQARVDPARPSRRWIAQVGAGAEPGFQAGWRRMTQVPRIVVALDASGSVDDARLALFWAEVTGIARRLRAELHVLVFDDAVRAALRVDPWETAPRLPRMPRDGGTDFRPVMAAAAELGASALVVLTDLDGEAGTAPRGVPVIWAVPDGVRPEAPFGRVVSLAA